MPIIFLSPSTQENNLYVNGGTEEQYMNEIADAMIPYLVSSGIQYTRNNRYASTEQAIRDSNAGNYDLHLAIHSNAAPEGRYGTVQGTVIFYDPRSRNGRRAAEIFAENLKRIYPDPSKVRIQSTTSLGEVNRTKAPAILVEVAYHDNVEDAQWIKNNINRIAQNLVLSLTEYFGIPFVPAQSSRRGRVVTDGGRLNIRSLPSMTGDIIARAPNGSTLTVNGQTGQWYVVNYNGIVGYAVSDYIRII